MNTLPTKTLSNDELMDKLKFAVTDSEQVFICDLCGAWSKSLKLLRHEEWCPDVGVNHGD